MSAYLDLSEAQWRTTVVELAETYGWRVYYVEQSTREIVRDGRRIRIRNVNRGGNGYPDLTMVRARDRRIIFAELKRGKRERRGGAGGGTYEVTDDQRPWLADLGAVASGIDEQMTELAKYDVETRVDLMDRGAIAARGVSVQSERRKLPRVEVGVWLPADYDAIERMLR